MKLSVYYYIIVTTDSNLWNLKKGGIVLEYKIIKTFDNRIAQYRFNNNMSQQELADIVGVSRQTIIQLEKNRYNPSLLLAYNIAKVFNAKIDDIFIFEEEKNV